MCRRRAPQSSVAHGDVCAGVRVRARLAQLRGQLRLLILVVGGVGGASYFLLLTSYLSLSVGRGRESSAVARRGGCAGRGRDVVPCVDDGD